MVYEAGPGPSPMHPFDAPASPRASAATPTRPASWRQPGNRTAGARRRAPRPAGSGIGPPAGPGRGWVL